MNITLHAHLVGRHQPAGYHLLQDRQEPRDALRRVHDLHNYRQVLREVENVGRVDAGARAKQLSDLAQTTANDSPAALLYSQKYLLITRRDLKGLAPDKIAEPADHLVHISSWYLKTAWALK